VLKVQKNYLHNGVGLLIS